MTETPPIRDATTTRRPAPPWVDGRARAAVSPTASPTTPRHLARVALGAAAVTAASLGVVVGAGVVPLSHGGAGGASLATGPVPDLPPSATASSSVSSSATGAATTPDPATDLGPAALDVSDPTATRPSTTLPRPSAPVLPPSLPLPPVSSGPVDPPPSPEEPEPSPDDPEPTPDDPDPTPDDPDPTPDDPGTGPGDDDGAGGPPPGGPTDPAGSSAPPASGVPAGLDAPRRVSASG